MEAYIEHFGYLAVLIGTLLEGETVLVLAGFAAHRGYLDLYWVIAAAFAGTLCGDQLFYYVGLKHSQTILHRRPAWQLKIDKAQELIRRHQVLIILGFRFFSACVPCCPSPSALLVFPEGFLSHSIFWAH